MILLTGSPHVALADLALAMHIRLALNSQGSTSLSLQGAGIEALSCSPDRRDLEERGRKRERERERASRERGVGRTSREKIDWPLGETGYI